MSNGIQRGGSCSWPKTKKIFSSLWYFMKLDKPKKLLRWDGDVFPFFKFSLEVIKWTFPWHIAVDFKCKWYQETILLGPSSTMMPPPTTPRGTGGLCLLLFFLSNTGLFFCVAEATSCHGNSTAQQVSVPLKLLIKSKHFFYDINEFD